MFVHDPAGAQVNTPHTPTAATNTHVYARAHIHIRIRIHTHTHTHTNTNTRTKAPQKHEGFEHGAFNIPVCVWKGL
jgi:hypothetical protein